MLAGAGLTVVASHGEPEAFLSSLRIHPPDVAVVSVPPEATSGWSALSKALAARPEVRLVVLAARADQQQPLAAGAAAVLEKRTSGCRELLEVIRGAGRADSTRLAASEPWPELEVNTRTPRALSPREREILSVLGTGADNLKIAALLGISERTVKAHVSNIYRKLGLENRTQLALYAMRLAPGRPTE